MHRCVAAWLVTHECVYAVFKWLSWFLCKYVVICLVKDCESNASVIYHLVSSQIPIKILYAELIRLKIHWAFIPKQIDQMIIQSFGEFKNIILTPITYLGTL